MSPKHLLPLAAALLTGAALPAQAVSTQGLGTPGGGGAGAFARTWEDLSPPILSQTSPLGVAVQPGNPDWIVVNTSLQGIAYSGDGGHSWHHNYLDFYIDNQTPSWWVNDVAFRPSAPNEAVAVTMSGAYWSTDGGVHWFKTAGQRPEGSFEVRAHPLDDAVAVAAGQSGKLWVYDWNTRTWPHSRPVDLSSTLLSVDFDLNNPAWLYVAHQNNPLWVTDDLGVTMRKYNRGLPAFTRLVRSDPELASYAHATSGGDLYRTTDGPTGASGGSWQQRGLGLPGTDILSLIHHPTRPELMFAGLVDHGVYFSLDRGASWRPVGIQGMSHTTVVDLEISWDDPQHLYAACHGGLATEGGVYRLRIRP